MILSLSTSDFLFNMKQFSLRTFFVPFGTFFAHDSTLPTTTRTTTTTTTKLLLGPLSIARGQKCRKLVSDLDGSDMSSLFNFRKGFSRKVKITQPVAYFS